MNIPKATSSGYTPKTANNEMCLRVMASYMDRTMTEVDVTGDADPADDGDPAEAGTTASVSRFLNTAFSLPTTPVRDDPENHAPEFSESLRRSGM